MIKKRYMDDHSKIQGTIDGLRAILVDVSYDTVRETVNVILPRRDVERIEVNRISYDKMTELLSVLSSYSRDGFERFLKAVAQANRSLEQTIKDVYFNEFRCHLDIPHVVEHTEVRPVSESHYEEERRNSGLVEVPEEPSHYVRTPYRESHDQDDAIGNRREIRDVRTPGQVPHAQGEASASSAGGNAATASDEVYEMDWNYPGLCLIINNRFSNDSENIRRGSEKDVVNMEHLFKDFLKFKVTKKTDLTADGMREALADHARYANTNHHYSALAVVLMSHGGQHDYIYGTDLDRANGINRSELMQCFNTSKCPAMKGKPKLFILQSCRGDLEDTREAPANVPQQSSNLTSSSGVQLQRDAIVIDGHRPAATSDTCFLYASSPGYAAYRHPEEGSYLVQEFMKLMKDHAHSKMYRDVLDMLLRKFNYMNLDNEEKRTMPEYTSTLTKKLYLKPPPQARGASSQ